MRGRPNFATAMLPALVLVSALFFEVWLYTL